MVVGMGKVWPARAKIIAIDKFPSPQTKCKLVRFLRMAGYYRSFCPNFSSVVPLTDLLQAKAKFVWTPKCENAFETVKWLLTSSPVLTAPRLDKLFKLQVDASQVGAGCALLQIDEDGFNHPIKYFSQTFKSDKWLYNRERGFIIDLGPTAFFGPYSGLYGP